MIFAGISAAYAQTTVSSADLISEPERYDGKTVLYTGEVVGDVMLRGTHAWVNVHDGVNAVGVWVPREFSAGISVRGGYKFRGDIVAVSGRFFRACGNHGGDMDIHADSLVVVSPGQARDVPAGRAKKQWAFRLLGAVGVLWILLLLKRR
jgi:hypothetical protein